MLYVKAILYLACIGQFFQMYTFDLQNKNSLFDKARQSGDFYLIYKIARFDTNLCILWFGCHCKVSTLLISIYQLWYLDSLKIFDNGPLQSISFLETHNS
jgi:hypothetical protein